MIGNVKSFFIAILLIGAASSGVGQKKYQSLMWQVSGNGLSKPSYLYGTMHISGKMVFHLGEPFYQAIKGVDMVALELEPEAWLKAIFEDQSSRWYASKKGNYEEEYYDYSNGSDVSELDGHFTIQSQFQDKLKEAMMYEPALLNYLLFRYGDFGYQADFEEDTWLDMYIYQTGKKLGKETMGLETYAQSDYFIRQARLAELDDEEHKEYDSKDIQDFMDIQQQFEPAYRRQDLDLIDSLNKLTTSEAFDKFILLERNKIFLNNIDSVLKSGKSLFAGMGCAHLPGKDGIIEQLRLLGYMVEPYNKGERNSRIRKKLDDTVLKRNFSFFETPDKMISMSAPTSMNFLEADKQSAVWIALDIPNGASFLLQRMKSYASHLKKSSELIKMAVDSILYESIAGDIISQRNINVNGFPAVDILNRTRRGDFQRRLIVVLPEEIVLLKLTATGEKVKAGYGNEIFNSLKFSLPQGMDFSKWNSPDQNFYLSLPSRFVYYENSKLENSIQELEVYAADPNSNAVFFIQRYTLNDPGFLDEDEYELNRLVRAFTDENHLIESKRDRVEIQGMPAMKVFYSAKDGSLVQTMFVLQNLNYYAFTTFNCNPDLAAEYFHSIVFTEPKYASFESYHDSMLCFQTQIPYSPKKEELSEDEMAWNEFGERAKNKNPYRGIRRSRTYNVPGQTDMIEVAVQRYHLFADGDDSLKFISDKEKSLTENGMQFRRISGNWNPHGCYYRYELFDSTSSRRYLNDIHLFNKSYYTLLASYNEVEGPGEFIKTFFDSFIPTDTAFAQYHFINQDLAFLEKLTSADSSTRVNAADIIDELDFSKDACPRIREILLNPPSFPKQELKEEVVYKLTTALSSDTSETNLQFITNLYYASMDSAVYQIELLRALARMKTQSSYANFRKLMIDEPPIVGERNSSAALLPLADSLELLAPMMIDFTQLFALDEYEDVIYELMAECLDSALIKPEQYKPLVKQIAMEAKNELKRLNAADESGYYFETNILLDYLTLLQPFRKEKEVEMVFDKVYQSKKNSLLQHMISFDLGHKKEIQDSLIHKIARMDEFAIPLYESLHKYHHEYQFPKEMLNREYLLEAYLRHKFSKKGNQENEIDSISVLSNYTDIIRGDSLEVYYCKFRKKKSNQWMGSIIAFEKSKDDLWPRFIERKRKIVLDADENELEELNREYYLLVEANRKKRLYSGGKFNGDFEWN